jgi:hypothetical protein
MEGITSSVEDGIVFFLTAQVNSMRGKRDYTEAIRIKPDDALAYSNRGIARFAKGDVDGALQDLATHLGKL